MKNKDVIVMLRRHHGEVCVDALVLDDTVLVRAVKADLLTILRRAGADGVLWEPRLGTDGVLYLHPAHDTGNGN